MSFKLSALSLCLLTALPVSAANLTGVSLFGVNSSGSQDNLYIWNTLGSDIPFNLYLQQGSFVNAGNGSGARVNVALVTGLNTFTYFADTLSGAPTNFGLNLFFDGNDTTPLISAKLVGGVLTANSAASTRQLNGLFVAGAGTLTFTDSQGIRYTLTAFTQSTTSNVVRPYDNVASIIPNNDLTGTITINVETPEPATFALAALGLGLVVMRRVRG